MHAKTSGEYAERGEYHRYLDPNWSYYPTYLAKMKFVRKYLQKVPKRSKILDVGCGEGVLVEELLKEGWGIIGLDMNYSSDTVIKGDITKIPFPDKHFDVVLSLDVIEHLHFSDQEKALLEIYRVLRDESTFITSIPNLAHLYSRISFLLKGELSRTSNIKKHPGDRPIKEYLRLLEECGFKVVERKGLFPTFPIIFQIIQTLPSKTLWLYKLNNLFAYPNWCLLNILICKKETE